MFKAVCEWARKKGYKDAVDLARFYDEKGDEIHANDSDAFVWKMADLWIGGNCQFADHAVEYHRFLNEATRFVTI